MNSFLCSLVLSLAMGAGPEGAAPIADADAITSAAVRQAYATVIPTLAAVKVQVLEDREAPYEERAPLEAVFDEFVRQRIPLRLIGTRVAADGALLIRDPNLPLRRYGEITAMDHAGRTTTFKIAAVLANHAAILLAPAAPPPEKLPFIAFEPAALKTGDPFLLADPALIEDGVAVSIDPYTAAGVAVGGREKQLQIFWWQTGGSYGDTLGNAVPATAQIVLDAQARPIGLALDNGLWRTGAGADSWIGSDIIADKRLSPADLEAVSQRILSQTRGAIKEIEVQFRADSRIGQQLGQEEGRFFVYGLHFDKSGRILAPTEMEREVIAQVDKFIIVAGDKRIEAEFEGLFRDFGAMVLRARDLPGEPATLTTDAAFPRGKVFYTLNSRRRFGQRFEEVEYNRFLDRVTGYKEVMSPLPRKPVRVGDLVADSEGRLVGFCAPFRREDKDEILARQSRRQGATARQTRIYLFADIRAALRDPGPHYDPVARPKTKKEEQRLVWLGVEYQPMTGPLARALHAEGPTRGGARGLLVTTVYDPSPASRLGIKVGDILLAIGIPGMIGDVDLVAPARDGARRGDSGRLWRSSANYLNLLLSQLGAGREIRLALLHEKKESQFALQLEKAPDDYDNADSYTEPLLGMSVKALTYEVRYVLRLGPDLAGVIVSDVTPGNKAALAQVRPYEIITRINDQPVTGVKEFERLVRAAQARGRAELLVVTLGMARIVEIDLGGGP